MEIGTDNWTTYNISALAWWMMKMSYIPSDLSPNFNFFFFI